MQSTKLGKTEQTPPGTANSGSGSPSLAPPPAPPPQPAMSNDHDTKAGKEVNMRDVHALLEYTFSFLNFKRLRPVGGHPVPTILPTPPTIPNVQPSQQIISWAGAQSPTRQDPVWAPHQKTTFIPNQHQPLMFSPVPPGRVQTLRQTLSATWVTLGNHRISPFPTPFGNQHP